MSLYQTPFISTLRQEPFQAYSQYTPPDCDGTACGGDLSAFCFFSKAGNSEARAFFFFPSTTTPTGCVIELNGTAASPSDCNIFQDTVCGDGSGAIYNLECQFANNDICDFGTPVITVNCNGEVSDPCFID